MERLLKVIVVFALALLLLPAAPAQGATQTVTYTYNGVPLPILVDSAEVATLARIFVPRSLTISNVSVQVQVKYNGVGDLNVYAFSPIATRTKLLERNCGSLVNIDTTFDDAATTSYNSFCPQEAGRGPYKSNEPLANFKNQNSMGTWVLAVENNGSDSRTGWITGFSVTITGEDGTSPKITPETVVNSAGLQSGAIAPGEIVSIFGFVLGPDDPVYADTSSGSLPTMLASTQVLFNDAPVPIGYVSAYRAEVQAPFTLVPGSSVKIQVKNGSASSDAVNVPVRSTMPGVFVTTPGGKGPALVANQDWSVNSARNPAAKGSAIVAYASGLGAVTPALTAGQATPAEGLSPTNMEVTASLGGIPAKVLWAGAAPGLIGYYQVNISVGQDVPSGTQPLVLSVGGSASQDGATVEIR